MAKSKKLDLLLVFIVVSILGAIVYLVFLEKPTGKDTGCSNISDVLHQCPGGSICGPRCMKNMSFNCDTRKCECSSGTLCENNSVCCPTCVNDLCCSEEFQIKKEDGTLACCPVGKIPSSDKKTCVLMCGEGDEKAPCGEGQECVKLTNISKNSNLYKTIANDTSNFRGGTDNSIYTCRTDSDTCSFKSPTTIPPTVDNYQLFLRNLEPEVCLPISENPNSPCYKLDANGCRLNSSCEWTNILDSYNASTTPESQRSLQNRVLGLVDGKGKQGYYCSDSNDTPYGYVTRLTPSEGASCSYNECLNAISNENVVDVAWNANTNVCSVLKSNLQSNIQNGIVCTGPKAPCSTCNQAGQLSDCVKCSGKGYPCTNCTSNEYINKKDCKQPTSQWNFQVCASGNDRLLNKNCPWGGTSPTDINTDDTNGSYSATTSTGGNVCFADGTVGSPTSVFYTAVTTDGSCTTLADNCQNVGKGVCMISPTKCDIGRNCYASKSLCEESNSCDEKNGYFRSADGRRCERTCPEGFTYGNKSPDGKRGNFCYLNLPTIDGDNAAVCHKGKTRKAGNFLGWKFVNCKEKLWGPSDKDPNNIGNVGSRSYPTYTLNFDKKWVREPSNGVLYYYPYTGRDFWKNFDHVPPEPEIKNIDKYAVWKEGGEYRALHSAKKYLPPFQPNEYLYNAYKKKLDSYRP